MRTSLVIAVIAFTATVRGFQAPRQSAGPPFTADYHEISHTFPHAPDEASRGRRVVQGRYWRDRNGRLRQEDWRVDAQGNRLNQRVFISDPALGFAYQLESDTKVAYRTPLQNHGPARAPSTGTAAVSTDLGTQKCEAFVCEGRRLCYLGRCEDTWWCPALQYVARIRTTYDNGVVEEMVWSNFKVGADPDPKLFVVPSDYTVVDRQRVLNLEPQSAPAVGNGK